MASIFCGPGFLVTSCSNSKPSSVSGSFTVRVLTGSEAKSEQQKLAASNKANFSNGSYAIITISWNGQWSGDCEIYAAMSHRGDGWRLSDYTPNGRIAPGADTSVAQAFAKYPELFAGIPMPPGNAPKAPNEDTFNLAAKKGTATITYAIDPSLNTSVSTDMNVAAEVDCRGKAQAASTFTPQ
ncbi:hypothetical protein [Catenulispora acidiphila]|uniref:hypothetical protein n=1 Tax=Catenulispora acidiphila TaxID=304895 RepID=UPI00117ECD61|nr:hypothetical protein [Catenulispora acidiphila]